MTDPWDERIRTVYLATWMLDVYGKCGSHGKHKVEKKKFPLMLESNMISKHLWLTAVVPVLWDVKNPNDFYISQKIVPNSKLPSHCKVQILSNHRIKWHILLPHVANQFLRHLSCMSGLPRSHLGTGLQCLGEVHLVRDHVASAEGIKANWRIYFLNTWIVSGILPGFPS